MRIVETNGLKKWCMGGRNKNTQPSQYATSQAAKTLELSLNVRIYPGLGGIKKMRRKS
jgi:hypothetical protein